MWSNFKSQTWPSKTNDQMISQASRVSAIFNLLVLAPTVTASCIKTCDDLTGWRDGFCDDENNNCGCGWDGGDCCRTDSDNAFCLDCLCLEPTHCYKWICDPSDVSIVCELLSRLSLNLKRFPLILSRL